MLKIVDIEKTSTEVMVLYERNFKKIYHCKQISDFKADKNSISINETYINGELFNINDNIKITNLDYEKVTNFGNNIIN
ncbi:hypothetical protein KHQ81_09635 [Mycoplasmatota bacterium]|nr:hypothetical protein KHQ81_09635 [Mycoplasmatota bacterium]